MTWTIKRKLIASTLVITVLLACFGLGVLPINLFFVKFTIGEAVREQLGADLDIQGPLRLRLGFNPSLSASAVSLSVPGSADQPLIVIGKLSARPQLLALLRGDIFLRSVEASGIVIDYCPQRFPQPGAADMQTVSGNSPGPLLAVGQLSLREIRLQCLRPARRLDSLPEVMDLRASAALNAPISLEVEGRGANEMVLSASGASLSELLGDPQDYPLTVQFNAPSAELQLDGLIRHPLSNASLQGRIVIGAENVSDLLAGFGLELPGLDAFSVHSDVIASRESFQFKNLEGVLNEIPFRLSGLARDLTGRPWLEIDAVLGQLDLARFDTEGGSSSTKERGALADFRPLFDGISGFDGRATLRIDRLLNAPVALNGLAIEASLDHGRLSLDHARLTLAGSEATLQAVLESGLDCPALDTRLQIANFDLESLNPFLDLASELSGHLQEIRLASRSCGFSLGEHIDSLNASAALAGLNPRLDDADAPLRLSRLELDTGWNQAGALSFDGELLGEKLSAEIDFASIEMIRSGEWSPLNITATGDEFQASLRGDAAISEDSLMLDVILAADVSRMGSLHEWLATAADSRLSFQGQAGLRLDEAGLSINDLDAALGRSDLSGMLYWAGPDGALPMSANLKSARLDLVEIADLFPARPAAEPEAEIDWVGLLDVNDQVEGWFSLPAIDFDFAVSKLEGILVDANEVTLHARLRNRLITEGRLDFQVEGIDIAGTLEADLRAPPWTIDFDSELNNVDIGRLLDALELAKDLDARAQRAKLSLVSEGNSLRQLVLNSRQEYRIEGLHWAFEAGPENRRFEIDLSELELFTSPGAKTVWQTSGTLNGSPVRAWMQTPSMHAAFEPSAELPIRLVTGTGDHVTMLDMTIGRASDNERRIRLEVSGDFMDSGSVDFASLDSPLGDYEFRTLLTVTDSEYLASDLQVRTGSSSISGSAAMRDQGPGYRFDIDLNSPFLETDDLVKWAADFRHAYKIVSREKASETTPTDENAGILDLIDRYVDEFSGENIFNVRAAVDELHSSGELLGNAQLEMKIDGDDFGLDPVKIALPGGNVDASYHGNYLNGAYEYSLDVNIERLEYGGLLRLFDPDSTAREEIFLDTSLLARSPDTAHAAENLEGYVDLALFPEDVQAGFLDLWASNLIFALLPGGTDSDKKMNCMVARFEVEKGVMKSNNTFLDSTDVIVRVRGDIDLGKRQLDLMVAPQAKLEKFLSVSTPIAVTGTFEDYRAGVAPGGFLTTMFRWYYGLVYVPWKWLTGERFPPDGIATCYRAMDWELP